MALTLGDRGAAVRRLQTQLGARGYDPGGADGVFGPKTQKAVMDFQRAEHLKVDGQVGENTQLAFQKARNTDGFEPARNHTPTAGGAEGTAVIQSTERAGRLNQMVTGTMTVNGNAYTFRSGGHGRGSLPAGQYNVTAHMWNRSDRSMSVGGVGFSFGVSDKFDPRVGGTRRLLRIHPDGGTAGTEGCMGIVGNADVQRRFREDMRTELKLNGGTYALTVQ